MFFRKLESDIEKQEIVYKEKNPKNKLISKRDVNSILKKYKVSHKIRDIEIFRTAFTHDSYCLTPTDIGLFNKNPEKKIEQEKLTSLLPLRDTSYQILEYIGDGILEIVVRFYLRKRYPGKDEHFYSNMTKKIVCGKHLQKLSLAVGFDKWILISKVEEERGARSRLGILEDVFEAFICALADDVGEENHYIVCRDFIVNVLEEHVNFTYLIKHDGNYKSQLIAYFNDQNIKHKDFLVEIKKFRISDDVWQITMGVKYFDGSIIGVGVANHRKDAEQRACKKALISLKKLDPNDPYVSDDEIM